MATAQDVSNAVNEAQQAGNLILTIIETVDPAVAAPAAVAQMLLDWATKAIQAAAIASGTPVTVEAAQALLAGLGTDPLSPATILDSGTPGVTVVAG